MSWPRRLAGWRAPWVDAARRGVALAALAGASLAVVGPSHAAGRRPYGGALRVPVADFRGVEDPHVARTPGQRLGASLAHGRLLRAAGAGFAGALAEGPGTLARDTLSLRLRPGARFHDGAPVTSGDVALSLRRAATRGPLGPLVALLRVEAVAPREVHIRGPRGVHGDTLRALLARPELAILHGGRPGLGRGCGPFRPDRPQGDSLDLLAFDSYARGRPWLDRVRLVRARRTRDEVSGLRFGSLDLAWAPSAAYRDAHARELGSWRTVFLVPAARWRGDAGRGLRRRLGQLAASRSLAPYVPWRVVPDAGLLPAALGGPGGRRPPSGGERPPALPALTLAFPAGDEPLASLGRVLRDRIAAGLGVKARVLPVPGLEAGAVAAPTTTSGALGRGAEAASWDFAVVAVDWAATHPALARWELAARFAAGPGTPLWLAARPPGGRGAGRALARAVLRGRGRTWLSAAASAEGVVPLLHARRRAFARRGAALAVRADARTWPAGGVGAADMPALDWTWVRP